MGADGRIHLCFLGCGHMTARHARFARRHSGDLALAFASRSLERAEAFSRTHKGVAAFGSYAEACASPDVDAVFVCTPPHVRVEPVAIAASSGKSIVIEKPVARSLAEMDEIVGIVERAGVRCMVAENYHFKPSLKALGRWVEEGAIGTPLFVEINHATRKRPGGWREDAEIMGGGALLEGGVHWVRALTLLGGPAEAVVAARPRGDYEARAPFEDSILVLTRFAGGAVGKLLHSWAAKTPLKGLGFSRLLGTDGAIHFESNGILLVLNGRRRAISLPSLTDPLGFRAMFRALVPYLRDGGQSPLSARDVYHDYAVVDAAYRSLETGVFETVASAPPGGATSR